MRFKTLDIVASTPPSVLAESAKSIGTPFRSRPRDSNKLLIYVEAVCIFFDSIAIVLLMPAHKYKSSTMCLRFVNRPPDRRLFYPRLKFLAIKRVAHSVEPVKKASFDKIAPKREPSWLQFARSECLTDIRLRGLLKPS